MMGLKEEEEEGGSSSSSRLLPRHNVVGCPAAWRGEREKRRKRRDAV